MKNKSNFFRPYKKRPNDAPFFSFKFKVDKNKHKTSRNGPPGNRIISSKSGHFELSACNFWYI